MLALTRKSGESLMVGDAKLLFRIEGNKVKVVIDAPRDVRVVRAELKELKNGKR